ncbi:MAG: Phage integrase family protein [Gammaproteobacteria bacterium]|jgi:site-specific recombinase XerD|nr:Phage integrase family protein [Gammaproteobacteria bacterium]
MDHFPIPFPIFYTNKTNFLGVPPIKIILPAFAGDDLEVAVNFLKQHDKKITIVPCSVETERLLLWAWFIFKKSILHLNEEDIQKYIEFRSNPPSSWVRTQTEARFIKEGNTLRPNPHWRPFLVTFINKQTDRKMQSDKPEHLPPKAETYRIFNVLRKLYTFLIAEKKVFSNPAELAWQKNRRVLNQHLSQGAVKRLTDIQWRYCVDAALQLAADGSDRHEKTLFIMSILYLLYPLPSELLASDHWIPKMNHFYQDKNQNWWFKVNKNGKLRAIAVSDDMLNALKRYRLTRGLTSLPSPEDDSPLLILKGGKDAISQKKKLKRLIQPCFDKAVIQLRKNDLANEADILQHASMIWIRHTGILDDIHKRRRPIKHVREDVGHTEGALKAIINHYKDAV